MRYPIEWGIRVGFWTGIELDSNLSLGILFLTPAGIYFPFTIFLFPFLQYPVLEKLLQRYSSFVPIVCIYIFPPAPFGKEKGKVRAKMRRGADMGLFYYYYWRSLASTVFVFFWLNILYCELFFPLLPLFPCVLWMETVILLLKNLLLVSKHPLTKHFLFLDPVHMSKTYVNPSCTRHYCCIPGHRIRRDQSGGTDVENNQINFLIQSEKVLGLK